MIDEKRAMEMRVQIYNKIQEIEAATQVTFEEVLLQDGSKAAKFSITIPTNDAALGNCVLNSICLKLAAQAEEDMQRAVTGMGPKPMVPQVPQGLAGTKAPAPLNYNELLNPRPDVPPMPGSQKVEDNGWVNPFLNEENKNA